MGTRGGLSDPGRLTPNWRLSDCLLYLLFPEPMIVLEHVSATEVRVHNIPFFLGSMHQIRTSRQGEPERYGWYARKGAATGNAWSDQQDALADLVLWLEGKPARMAEVVTLH